MYRTIDLFAGAGGLSLGFLQTGKFDIKVAYENNPNMQKTYRENHKGVDVRGDVCGADFTEIQKQYGPIDVVIGGPPCQGFSNANRQKNHAISQNNMLVKQYIRAIRELQPKAFVMENVSMLRSDVHRFYLNRSDVEIIKEYQVPTIITKLPLLEGKYRFDDAMHIVQDPELISEYLWLESDYAELNVIYKTTKNPQKLRTTLQKHKKELSRIAQIYVAHDQDHYIWESTRRAFRAIQEYYDGERSDVETLKDEIEPAIMIQRMLSKAKEIFDNDIVVEQYTDSGDITASIKSYAVYDYLKRILGSAPYNYTIESDVLCAANYGAPQKRMRFVVVGIKSVNKVELPERVFTEDNYRTVYDAIGDLEDVKAGTDVKSDIGIPLVQKDGLGELAASLRDAPILKNQITTSTRATAMERFKVLKQGQNFHALDESLKTTYTDASRTQNTIYLRLKYDQPSGTVVNVRKSMWIHPVLDRAVSIREAARLQTFPDSFVFYGSKDKQYQQVGNAVPPIMAKAIAEKLAEQLEKLQETDVTNK